jgi:uncharacterized protein YecT (DUF1311 family)
MRDIHTPLLLVLLLSCASGAITGEKITEAEIVQAILPNTDCERPDQVHIDHLEYFDFTGDGQDEAVVVASTCMTGTAGPDIHAVYSRGTDGKVYELPVAGPKTVDEMTPSKYGMLFGNRNFSLRVEQGLLVETYSDTSDRPRPLVIRYKWSGKEFVVDSVEKTGPFQTSYDCSKAAKEIDQAICYAPAVAALDLEMGRIYRERLRNLTTDKKQRLQQDQMKWLAQRNYECGNIYKWWVECLTDKYRQRIAELQKL